MLQDSEQPADILQERGASGGQCSASTVSVKKYYPYLILKLFDRSRQGGLFDMQALRSTCEMQLLSQDDKTTKVPQFHVIAIRLSVYGVAATKIYHLFAYPVTYCRRGITTSLLCIQHVAQPARELFALGHAEAARGHGGRANAKA